MKDDELRYTFLAARCVEENWGKGYGINDEFVLKYGTGYIYIRTCIGSRKYDESIVAASRSALRIVT